MNVSAGAKNSLQKLVEACFVSTVTCGTCCHASDSQQSCWVMTLPIQAVVLDSFSSESDYLRVSKDKLAGRATQPKDSVKEKSARMNSKAQKAKLKAEKRAERRQRKGRNSHGQSDGDCDISGAALVHCELQPTHGNGTHSESTCAVCR